VDERPELRELSPGHECACWFPIDLDAAPLVEAKI
jgi:hypothetical protein